jgi:hypothetical protein
MASGFLFRGGPWELDSALTTASTALAVLDALTTTTGKLALQTDSTKTTGVSLGTKASGDAATTAIQFIRALPNRTRFMAQAKNSSSLAATDLHAQVDYYGASGAGGFDRAVTTNGGVYLHKILSTGTSGQAVIMFTNPIPESST